MRTRRRRRDRTHTELQRNVKDWAGDRSCESQRKNRGKFRGDAAENRIVGGVTPDEDARRTAWREALSRFLASIVLTSAVNVANLFVGHVEGHEGCAHSFVCREHVVSDIDVFPHGSPESNIPDRLHKW